MEPALKGTWQWDSDRSLRFQPAEDWPIGTRFNVSLAQHGFAAPHVHLKDYGFSFDSPYSPQSSATLNFTRIRWWPPTRRSSSR